MANEPDGFKAYVIARQGDLLRLARMLTGDWASAEDLVQVSLERVWPRWNRIVRDGDPDAYVRRVLVNAHLKSGRRRWRGEVPFADVPDRPGDDRFDDADLRHTVHALLPSLPPRQRAVLVLRFFLDLTEPALFRVVDVATGATSGPTAQLPDRGCLEAWVHPSSDGSRSLIAWCSSVYLIENGGWTASLGAHVIDAAWGG